MNVPFAPVLAAAVGIALAPIAVPTLDRRVNDHAGILRPADAAALEALLADLERTDSTQVVLLTVRTTGELPIEDYALEVARANRIGQAGRNNGALVLVAVDDRRARIEVGEGLEGRVPDTVAALILKHEMVPRFRAGDLSGGVRAGVEALVRAVRGEYRAPEGGALARRTDGRGVHGGERWIVFAVVVAFIAQLFRAAGRTHWAFALAPVWAVIGWLFAIPLLAALATSLVATAAGVFGGAGQRGTVIGRRGYRRGGGFGPIVMGGGFGGFGGGRSSGGGFDGFSGGGGRFAGGGASSSW